MNDIQLNEEFYPCLESSRPPKLHSCGRSPTNDWKRRTGIGNPDQGRLILMPEPKPADYFKTIAPRRKRSVNDNIAGLLS